ncbi:HNH endonuclease [Methanosarcina sp. MSH10X1]|uniref:HNH endonuclease n=1 Tax=Methanosarcina sp. MSH10X1 TaxID=2507075 RepID=UPI0013E3AEED|nr:HNH endonuclease signature motif containing protein [Methanosarcina sp. MSH10X1]
MTEKRRTIDKNTRDAVWIKYMGNKVEGKCYCCKIRTIHVMDFQVGHNKAVAKGGNDNISNLRPICGPCNRGMGTKSIEKYREKFGDPHVSKKEPRTSEKKVTKKNLLENLATAKLEKLVRIFDLESKLPVFPNKEDYIKVLSSSRRVTVDGIKNILVI